MIDLRIMDAGVGIEKTAEWVYNTVSKYVKESTDGRVSVTKVEVWEHEGNSAIYEESLTAEETRETDVEKAHEEALKENEPVSPPEPESRPYGTGEVSTGLSDPFKGTSWGN